MKAITVTFHGPTNTRGARLIADDGHGNRVTIPFPYELERNQAFRFAARTLCEKMGWQGVLCQGWTKYACVFTFVSDTDSFTVGAK